MYSTYLDDSVAGEVLARDVLTDDGTVLLAAGVELTAQLIGRLQRRGVPAVHLRDGVADDVLPSEVIEPALRASVTNNVKRISELIMSTATDLADGPGGTSSVAQATEATKSMGVVVEEEVAGLHDTVAELMEAVLTGDSFASLIALKSHNNYTFEHSVDVAVISTLIGSRAGLTPEQLHDLALGAVLHDIGKQFIDTAILDKPEQLTPEEFEKVKEHPEMGYQLLRNLELGSLIPPQVAWQHHERQDGGGYPRGLSGANTLEKSRAVDLTGGRMLLIAEVAAVADVYSAIASDRPYRKAMPADKVRAALTDMSGSHVNREAVRLLLSHTTAMPVGSWVDILSAGEVRWRGVVVAVNPQEPERPRVRITLDATATPISAYEVDLAREDALHARPLPVGADPKKPPQPVARSA